jgi:hypothetical protein
MMLLLISQASHQVLVVAIACKSIIVAWCSISCLWYQLCKMLLMLLLVSETLLPNSDKRNELLNAVMISYLFV